MESTIAENVTLDVLADTHAYNIFSHIFWKSYFGKEFDDTMSSTYLGGGAARWSSDWVLRDSCWGEFHQHFLSEGQRMHERRKSKGVTNALSDEEFHGYVHNIE